MHASRWGVIVWPLNAKKFGLFKFFEFVKVSVVNPTPWKVFHIHSLSMVSALKLAALPPVDQKLPAGTTAAPGGIVFGIDGQIEALLKFGARRGFAPLTVPTLQELVDLIKFEPPADERVPTKEFELAKALVKNVFPDLSEDELLACLAFRQNAFRETSQLESDLLKGDAAEDCAGADILDTDDHRDVKAEKKKILGSKAASPVDSGSAGSSSSVGAIAGGKPVVPKVSVKSAKTPEDA